MIADIDPAYVPSLLCRISPFEQWVIERLAGSDRTAADIGADCGLRAGRILEIADEAVAKMKAMQTLAAD